MLVGENFDKLSVLIAIRQNKPYHLPLCTFSVAQLKPMYHSPNFTPAIITSYTV